MKIYKYSEDFGRMGDLEGVFVADDDTITELRKVKEIYLGEVLGKHSEVYATVDDSTLKEISDDPVIVAFFKRHFCGSIGVNLVGRYGDLKADGFYDER